jgi:predicted RNase H-like nuclease
MIALWADDARLALCETFAAALAFAAGAEKVAVDMPIGLPDRIGEAGRGCDRAARVHLGGRQSSLFAVPSRAAVMEKDYAAVCAAALRTSDPPRKVSKQCFNLFPKIRELDALMTPALQRRVVESHPELAFWAMNGERPLDLPKRVKSQPHEPGLKLRRALLEQAGFPVAGLDRADFPRALAGPDDILDAAACAVVARKVCEGRARRFPEEPSQDARGLRMEIWA